jgi:hypothetical protein
LVNWQGTPFIFIHYNLYLFGASTNLSHLRKTPATFPSVTSPIYGKVVFPTTGATHPI